MRDRFIEQVDFNEDGHWYWLGGRSSNGYGAFWLNGKTIGSHRVAFFLREGHWPVVARHACEHRHCVKHIVDGSQHQNVVDAITDGVTRADLDVYPCGHPRGFGNDTPSENSRRCTACFRLACRRVNYQRSIRLGRATKAHCDACWYTEERCDCG